MFDVDVINDLLFQCDAIQGYGATLGRPRPQPQTLILCFSKLWTNLGHNYANYPLSERWPQWCASPPPPPGRRRRTGWRARRAGSSSTPMTTTASWPARAPSGWSWWNRLTQSPQSLLNTDSPPGSWPRPRPRSYIWRRDDCWHSNRGEEHQPPMQGESGLSGLSTSQHIDKSIIDRLEKTIHFYKNILCKSRFREN